MDILFYNKAVIRDGHLRVQIRFSFSNNLAITLATDTRLMEVLDEYEELPEGTSPLINLTAGALAGIFEHTVTFPLTVSNPFTKRLLKQQFHAHHPKPRDSIDRFQEAVAWSLECGDRSGTGPRHILCILRAVEETFLKPEQSQQTKSVLLGCSGAIATILSDAVMTPFDVIKQKITIESASRINFVCKIDRAEGRIRALYLSYPTTLLLNVPSTVSNSRATNWSKTL